MSTEYRLLAILSHPDDETLGFGGTLARYAAEGAKTYLLTATRGEHGWRGDSSSNPGKRAVGRIREGELWGAAKHLNLRDVTFLDYEDGVLDQAPALEIIGQIAAHIRRVRPHIVLTFDPYGFYGHPDHIATAQFTTAAVVDAVDRRSPSGGLPHRVQKLYYRVPTAAEADAYQAVFGDLVMKIDGVERRTTPWPEWAITTRIDTRQYVSTVWSAMRCHASQLSMYEHLLDLTREDRERIFGEQTYYRAFSMVNGGRRIETDLTEGVERIDARKTQPINLSSLNLFDTRS